MRLNGSILFLPSLFCTRSISMRNTIYTTPKASILKHYWRTWSMYPPRICTKLSQRGSAACRKSQMVTLLVLLRLFLYIIRSTLHFLLPVCQTLQIIILTPCRKPTRPKIQFHKQGMSLNFRPLTGITGERLTTVDLTSVVWEGDDKLA